MKFTPKHLENNVNISKTHPLVELLWLAGGLALIVGLSFFTLGATSNWAVSKIPISVETWIGQLAINEFPGEKSRILNRRLQLLLANLPTNSPLHQYEFKVFLAETDEVNAIALPGGNIVVFSGLLQAVESENELTMILAHELGHFAHRDHLRGLGRGLGIAVATVMLFGENSATSNIISKTLLTFNNRYSQAQEAAADQFGIDLLNRHYGHAGGATDFFSRIATDAGNQTSYLLASHPHPQARIDALQLRITEQNYRIEKTVPLRADIKKDKDNR